MLLPSKDLFDGTRPSGVTTADMRIAFGQLRDFLAALIGEDSDDKAKARSLLGVVNTVIEPGKAGFFFGRTAPPGWLKANGSAVPVDSYVNLANYLYCGDAANANAAWGFRCTNPNNPSGTRSTTGAHIVLPDARGEYLRAWDDGRGVDPGRSLWMWQGGQIQYHSHSAWSSTEGQHAHNYMGSGQVPPGGGYSIGGGNTDHINVSTYATDVQGAHAHGIGIGATGGSENLVRNISLLVCIKY